MDFRNFKIVKKDKIDEAQDRIMDDVAKQIGLEKYYILGEINILRTLIDDMKNDDDFLYRKDLVKFVKSSFKDYDWAKDIVNSIVEKYEWNLDSIMKK